MLNKPLIIISRGRRRGDASSSIHVTSSVTRLMSHPMACDTTICGLLLRGEADVHFTVRLTIILPLHYH